MVTLRVSLIPNKYARRAVIVATFFPMMALNITSFTAKIIWHWLSHIVCWPWWAFQDARDVW